MCKEITLVVLLGITLGNLSVTTGLDKDCQSPPVTGPCEAIIPRYYYDSESHQCKKFNFGGCGGNGNRYETIADCLSACSGLDKDCQSPPVTGPCEAIIPRYYYDPESHQCKKFNFGGCGGNGNRYETIADCLSACSGLDKDCQSPPVTGPCEAIIPRYYYDPESHQCKKFNFGGCGGNGNRYETIADCLSACSGRAKDCKSPPVSGPCTANIPSYYYDPDSHKCKKFIFGGCDGNENRYRSEADCLAACLGT
ncbi:carboxypeptidase inhibitor SmCI-like isoform X3 [Tachypleus tridentatus]|uniref:carboxypeptidase inhibitor SmCI-like isoform X3 n=1 Tax=Tachypleus tridentatus TaxID=6853 RepID=UPI003FD50809